MRAAISLLVLLFSMCGAQTRSTQTEVQTGSQGTGAAAAEVQTESQDTGAAAAAELSTQLDVSAELKELRDMVVEQGVMLRYTQEEVKVLEAENEAVKSRLAVAETEVTNLKTANRELKTRLDATEPEIIHLKFASEDALAELEKHEQELAALKMENGELKTRLAASEAEVEDLKMDSAAHEQELAALKTGLAASETEVVNLKMENGELKTRMAASETVTDDLKVENAAQEAELTAVKTRLAATETGVENLENEIKAAPKVAFSAGLTNLGYIQSGSNDLNLVFSKVFTNVGQAYSSTTGFFTAPVRGVYYFRFTVVDALTSRYMFIRMHKNGQQVIRLYRYDYTEGGWTYLSSGLTLQLEKGDVVNMVIPAGYRLHDDSDNRSTFSGFLLFPL